MSISFIHWHVNVMFTTQNITTQFEAFLDLLRRQFILLQQSQKRTSLIILGRLDWLAMPCKTRSRAAVFMACLTQKTHQNGRMTCLFYCHINYFTFSHHFASDVSFGIIKHLLTRYSGNSKFIKLLTFHLRTPICIKHTPKWQKKYQQIPKMYVILFITHHRYHSLTHLKKTAIEIQGIKIIKKE